MSNLAIPGQTALNLQYIATPAAQQTIATLQKPGGMEMHVFGGLTKLEHFASAIAGADLTMTPEQVALRARHCLDACAALESSHVEKKSPIT